MKFLTALLLTFAIGASAATNITKISDYPNTATLNGTDLFLIAVPGVTNENISWTQLQALLPASGSTNQTTIGTNDYFQGGVYAAEGYFTNLDADILTISGTFDVEGTLAATNATFGTATVTNGLTAGSVAIGATNVVTALAGKQASFTTGTGVTNTSNVITLNLTPGTTLVFTTNANGAISIDVASPLNLDTVASANLVVTNAISALKAVTETVGSIVVTNGMTNNGVLVYPASTLQTLAAGATIAVSSYANRVVGSNSLAVVLTSTPEIATNSIADGTEIRVLGTSDSYTVTLNDSRTTAGSGSALYMEAPTCVLYNGGVISFRYSTNINRWKETARSQNGSQVTQFANINVATNATVGGVTLLTAFQATNANLTAVAADAAITKAASQTVTNKSFTAKSVDATTGNTLRQMKHLFLMRPDYGDGAGAVPQTNSYVASGLMHYTFSGNAETNVNWVVYETIVPPDIDTTVAMTATIAFVSGGTDADTVTFHLTYALGAAGTALPTGTSIATSPIVVTITPSTPASGDVQISAATTLTGWAAAMTAGTPLLIRMARLQDSNDDSNRDMYLDIAYGSTQ